MDKKRSLKNVGVAVGFKFLLMFAYIIARRCLIQYIGNEVNGLSSLYTSIIGVLSVAELGVGSAITFCMYRPIVEGDDDKVAALYQLFKKTYLIIGGLIFVVGLLLMPFLRYLAKDYSEIDVNLQWTFFLMLVTVVATYMYSAKISLINAYKNDYITTTITSTGALLQQGLQILAAILTGSFVVYLICALVSTIFQWVLVEIVAPKKHGNIIKKPKQVLGKETKRQVVKNVKALFMHRIGGILVNTADSIIISGFIGVVILGKYANYTLIITSMISVMALFFTPLTAIIGHMYVSEKEQMESYASFFHTFNFLLGLIFFLGYYAVVDDLIRILFGDGLELAKSISFVITLNYFIQFMRQSVLLFRDATGAFYNDRWKPFVEGSLNVILSIAMVLLLSNGYGEEMGIVGVIIATIITNLTICHIVEPYVLYKYAFGSSPKKHIIKNFCFIGVFAVMLLFESQLIFSFDNKWTELFANGGLSLAISGLVAVVVFAFDKNFRSYLKSFIKKRGD